jgi:LysM repeat protein
MRMDRQMRLLRFCLIATVVVAAFLGAGPVLAAATPAVQAQDQIVHVVQQGENLFRLALRYGTTVEAIMAANGLTDEHKIGVGQRLIIPDETATPASAAAAATTGGTYVVQPGDTLIGIALRYGVALWELMHANGVFGSYRIYPGQGLVIPGAGGAPPEPVPETSTTYVVRPGDTLTQIARRFNTTAFALAHSNGIADPSAIRVGQVLRVPRAASGSPAPSGGRQRILINLSEQHLYAYQGDQLVYSFVCSSGRAPTYTRTGEFQVQSKIPNAYGATWDIWMPNWLGIYWAGSTENGIHALPIMSNGQTLWAGYLGSPISYGCIVLGTYEAQLLYEWAEIGTPVSIRY